MRTRDAEPPSAAQAECEQRQAEIEQLHARFSAMAETARTHRRTIAHATYALEQTLRDRAALEDALTRAILDFPL